jgi:hypothetical protein
MTSCCVCEKSVTTGYVVCGECEKRTVVFDFAIGDTVFEVYMPHLRELGSVIYKHVIEYITVHSTYESYGVGTSVRFYNTDIGKTIFRTREEAEKALEKLKVE